MKKFILAVLTVLILAHAPWKLIALGVEVFNVTPGLTRISRDDAHYWQALNLEERLIASGWSVKYAPIEGDVFGETFPDRRAIVIEDRLHWNARYAVLAHEAGHTLQPAWATRNQGEVFAECVAALLAQDGLREHARYLAKYRGDFLLTVFVEWPAMYRAAALLED